MGDTPEGEEGSVIMESVEEVKRKGKGRESRFGRRYGFEVKLRCVKLYLEEGLPLSLLSKEVGASTDGIRRWVKAYQERGEEGLRNRVRSLGSRRKLPGPVRKKEGCPAGIEVHLPAAEMGGIRGEKFCYNKRRRFIPEEASKNAFD